jgi:hypothetical protein
MKGKKRMKRREAKKKGTFLAGSISTEKELQSYKSLANFYREVLKRSADKLAGTLTESELVELEKLQDAHIALFPRVPEDEMGDFHFLHRSNTELFWNPIYVGAGAVDDSVIPF